MDLGQQIGSRIKPPKGREQGERSELKFLSYIKSGFMCECVGAWVWGSIFASQKLQKVLYRLKVKGYDITSGSAFLIRKDHLKVALLLL